MVNWVTPLFTLPEALYTLGAVPDAARAVR